MKLVNRAAARRGAGFAVLCLAGCASASAQQPDAHIEGTVSDAAGGDAIVCAAVVLTAADENTFIAFPDDAGSFRFDAVATGFHQLAVYAPGYRTQSFPFYAAPGAIRSDFLMTKHEATKYVSGTVLAQESGLPIAGALVEALLDGQQTGLTYSCASGAYEITLAEDFAGDIVWLQVSAPGRTPALAPADVSGVNPADVQLQVAPAEGGKPCSVLGCGAAPGNAPRARQTGPQLIAIGVVALLLRSRRRAAARGTRQGTRV